MKLATPNADKTTANSAAVAAAPTTPTRPGVDQRGHDEMLTKRELAARFKVTVRTIEKWLKDGFIPRIRIVRVVRFYWPEVVAHLLKNSSGPGPKVLARLLENPAERGANPKPEGACRTGHQYLTTKYTNTSPQPSPQSGEGENIKK